MTLESIKDKINEVGRLLDGNHVADAFVILENIAQEEQNYKATDNLKRLRQTYGYMVHYLIEGVDDKTRREVYDGTLSSLRLIANDILLDKLVIDSPDVYFSTARICRHRNLRFEVLWNRLKEVEAKLSLAEAAEADVRSILVDKYNLMRQLFDTVWTMRNDKDICGMLVEKINQSGAPEMARYLISAITLSLLEYFDRDKFVSLIDIYENAASQEISACSLVGTVLALRKYRKRIVCDNKIIARLQLWQDSLVTYSRLRSVVKEIIRTRDTDRVTAKMRDEVIPELMKLKPDVLRKMKESAMDFESGMLDNNPEWEEILEKNGIADKMRELTEMQSEGADLMMVTFSNLKGFPFFNNVSAWFLPFDIDNPDVNLDSVSRKSLDSMLTFGVNMCDSDKYSLVLAFSTMPEQQRNMMTGQFEQQLSQMMEQSAELLEKQSQPEFSMAAVVFIRELYRFFRLFRKKSEFDDPFSEPFNFLDLPVVGDMMADEEIIKLIGEFYFKRGYYEESLELFKAIENSSEEDYSYWEKIGYAYQALKQYDKAAAAYRKSELLGDSGTWLLKKLAFINKKNGNYAAAAEYYSRALLADPDNVSLIMNAGYANLESGDIAGALRSFYHANYLQPDNAAIWRAIGWTEFINGNYDKSCSYYEKLLESNPTAIDLMNAAHVKLASGNIKEATALYKKSAGSGFEDFQSAFETDVPTLEKAGIDRLTIDLIIDAIKMDLC